MLLLLQEHHKGAANSRLGYKSKGLYSKLKALLLATIVTRLMP